MGSLLDILFSYPILESLVSVLPLGDLLNLSKASSKFRAALHGFQVSHVYTAKRLVQKLQRFSQ